MGGPSGPMLSAQIATNPPQT
ncbi:DUF6053 domain-containing protein [Lysobacter gummosus]